VDLDAIFHEHHAAGDHSTFALFHFYKQYYQYGSSYANFSRNSDNNEINGQ
jgi:hypothetical protein